MNTNNIHNEEEFPEIREQLSRLPTLRASDDFVKNLQLKIDIHNAETQKVYSRTDELQKAGFFKNIFGAGWVMPAAGVAVAAAIILSVVFWNNRTDDSTKQQLSQNTPQVIQNNTANTDKKTDVSKDAEVKKETILTPEKTSSQNIASNDVSNNTSKSKVNTKTELYSSKISDQPVGSQITQNKEVPTSVDKNISSNHITEEKSSKINESEDANLRKLQMGNVRGGNVKANPPVTSQSAIDQSGRTNSSADSKIAPAPVKKSVKDVIDISKTSLETIREKIK